MAIPRIFNTGYKRVAATLSTNTGAAMILVIRDMLTVTLDVADRWTESPANTFISPADSVGRFMKFVVTSSGDGMTFQVYNAAAQLVMDGKYHVGGGKSYVIWAGPKHFYMEIDGLAAFEFGGCFLSEPDPESLNVNPVYVYATSARSPGGGLFTNYTYPDYGHARDADNPIGTADALPRLDYPYFAGADAGASSIDAGGAEIAWPVGLAPYQASAVPGFSGNLYQCCWVDGGHAAGDIVEVNLGEGVQGYFEVTRRTKVENDGPVRWAIRKA